MAKSKNASSGRAAAITAELECDRFRRFRRGQLEFEAELCRRFEPAIEAFGPLPVEARAKLAMALNLALADAVLANKFDLAPAEHAKRLGDISVACLKLLKLLDAEDGRLPTWVGPLLLKTAQGGASLPSLVASLLVVIDAASGIAKNQRKRQGRGGATRAGPGPAERLYGNVFNIYRDFRKRFPDSGRLIGFGGPLLRFVKAVFALTNEVATEGSVKSAFGRWRRLRKPKRKPH